LLLVQQRAGPRPEIAGPGELRGMCRAERASEAVDAGRDIARGGSARTLAVSCVIAGFIGSRGRGNESRSHPITAAQLRMNCIMASIGLKRTGVPVPATRPLKNARKAERHFHGAAATTAHERTVASTRPFGADRRRRIATRLSNGPLALSWIFLGP